MTSGPLSGPSSGLLLKVWPKRTSFSRVGLKVCDQTAVRALLRRNWRRGPNDGRFPSQTRHLLLVHRIPGKDRIVVPQFLVDAPDHVIRSVERSWQDLAVVIGGQDAGVAVVGQRIEALLDSPGDRVDRTRRDAAVGVDFIRERIANLNAEGGEIAAAPAVERNRRIELGCRLAAGRMFRPT